MPPTGHAMLGASSSHRWLNCPPSARLSENFPSSTTSFAEAGTVAHALCELKVRYELLGNISKDVFAVQYSKLQASEYYDKGMEDSSDTYLEFIREMALSYSAEPFIALETRVDYSKYVPRGFGTADCVLLGDDTITVVDYKNGSGVVVEVEDNPQLKLYALGAYLKFGILYDLRTVRLAIVQPNAGGCHTWELPLSELLRWAEEDVAPVARMAAEGKGEFKCGEWCRFCPAKAQCRCRAETLLALGKYEQKKPDLLDPAEIAEVIAKGDLLVKWLSDVKEHALKSALSGSAIPGMKVVEGRGSRDWKPNAFTALQAKGVPEAILYERKPVTVAALEKSLGKKAFSEYADLVDKKPGKPALVPMSDRRAEYNPAAIAFKDVTS